MDRLDTREWLTTNGLGGYASGAVCGANTRRYHGLLVAALDPPGQRTVLLSRIDETVSVGDDVYALATNVWQSGAIAPAGYRNLIAFQAHPVPTWEYGIGLGRLVKRVACLPARNAVTVSYRLDSGPPVRLDLVLLANNRDIHGETHGHPDWQFQQGFQQGQSEPNQLRVAAWDGAPAWTVTWSAATGSTASYEPVSCWYWGYAYPEEAARGLPATEDNYCLGRLSVHLQPGERLDLWASVEPLDALPTTDALADAARVRRRELVAQAGLQETPEAEALVAAADQFLVRRASTDNTTVIAGYHWFEDWGRDAMIALPGLTLTTRRFAEARSILRTFAQYVDRGMLPNRFPDGGNQPEYTTVDATLWWFHALHQYLAATGDDDLVREQYPLLADVIEWHLRGTRHGIQADPDDGLLLAGAPGLQLTWMDARVGEWVVTPRDGKPVEVNALWLHALAVLAEFAARLGWPADAARYQGLADRARTGMQAFWSAEYGYLFDVIGRDGVGDPSLRPNQLVAFGLPTCAFSREQGEAVLSTVESWLMTPYGPRTLAPGSRGYVGHYAGDVRHRDSAYHQGTVWPWLLGAYADALVRVRGLTPATRAMLAERIAPLLRHLEQDACIGSISEIFDGAPPHAPQGAVAQAWSVAAVLRLSALTASTPPSVFGDGA